MSRPSTPHVRSCRHCDTSWWGSVAVPLARAVGRGADRLVFPSPRAPRLASGSASTALSVVSAQRLSQRYTNVAIPGAHICSISHTLGQSLVERALVGWAHAPRWTLAPPSFSSFPFEVDAARPRKSTHWFCPDEVGHSATTSGCTWPPTVQSWTVQNWNKRMPRMRHQARMSPATSVALRSVKTRSLAQGRQRKAKAVAKVVEAAGDEEELPRCILQLVPGWDR
jgi:hypothetical protein